ncbi:MAG: hypothetical protein RLY31_3050 [Bacteroidota bacterium]|jgi:hypothetical protein
MMELRKGIYRHFKGRHYRLVGTAVHSETNEEMVVYEPLYGKGGWWVRPLRMFVETVRHEGRDVERFEYIGETIPPEAETGGTGPA